MHSPFVVASLIPSSILGQEPITAILLHANRIILGTEKGTLLVFDLSSASTSTAPPAATFVSRHDGFSKKSIEQLGVIKELNALVCLSGGDIALYSLPTFSLLSSFSPQTKASASLFTISTFIHSPLPIPRRSGSTISNTRNLPSPVTTTISSSTSIAPQEIHTTLVVACKRKLIFFNWIDGNWNPISELSLPHQIRGMTFTGTEGVGGGRKIVAGFSTGEFGIITLGTLNSTTSGGNYTAPGSIATLGELFTPNIPTSVLPSLSLPPISLTNSSIPTTTTNSGMTSSLSLSSLSLGTYGERLGGLAKATSAGLGGGLVLGGLAKYGGLGMIGGGKKVEKNGVVSIPRRKGKEVERSGAGSWLSNKDWGWEEEGDAEGEVLVTRENIILPLTSSGKPRKVHTTSCYITSQAIIYPTATDETLVLPPYIISLLPSSSTSATSPSLVIHSVDSLTPIQNLDIPIQSSRPTLTRSDSKSSTISSSQPDSTFPSPISTTTAKYLTVAYTSPQPPLLLLTNATNSTATEQTIWIVTMKNWQVQIEELSEKGSWEEGIRLLRGAGNGGGDLSPSLHKKLATLHSLTLFNSNLYDLAIDAFISLNLCPAKVISLYPEKISGKLLVESSAQEELFGGRSKDIVEAALEEAEREKEETRIDEIGRDDDTSSIRSGMGSIGRVKGRKVDAAGSILDAIAERTNDHAKLELANQKASSLNFTRSVDVLIRYLTDRRQKYTQALSALPPSSRPTPSQIRPRVPGEELLSLPDLPLNELKPDELARVAMIVDTALFKSYLATKPVMVGPLCRVENWCEVEEVEELLLSAKKFRELLDLYNGKNMHEKALVLLRQMSEDEDDLEEKVGPTIRYLQKLGSEHLDLIFETSRWVFETDRKAGLEIFIADLEEVESLPRHATMSYLETIGSDLCVAYLEHVIHGLGEEGSEFHEKLIELYLSTSNLSKNDVSYTKLVEFLEFSTAYRADRILGRLPSEDMYQVRAILLGRLGRHEGALQIYVYQLDDQGTAEEYCKRVYESDPSMRSSIFHILLRIYLRPRPTHPLLFTPALSLISNHASSIDAIEVFDLLPPLVALSDIKVFLEKTLRRSGERAREGRVVKGIGRSRVDIENREVVALEERRVKITDSRVCPQCNKRLGNSVIAIHSPHGEVTHYQCREAFLSSKS